MGFYVLHEPLSGQVMFGLSKLHQITSLLPLSEPSVAEWYQLCTVTSFGSKLPCRDLCQAGSQTLHLPEKNSKATTDPLFVTRYATSRRT